MKFETPFIIAASSALTPLVTFLWGRVFPPKSESQFNFMAKEELKRRNNWIDLLMIPFSLLGFIAPMFLFKEQLNANNWRVLGLSFGLMVLLPVAILMVVTLPLGINRLNEFLRFYELKYKIGMMGIGVVYIPFATLGLYCLYQLIP
jgi:hypothetical protein